MSCVSRMLQSHGESLYRSAAITTRPPSVWVGANMFLTAVVWNMPEQLSTSHPYSACAK